MARYKPSTKCDQVIREIIDELQKKKSEISGKPCSNDIILGLNIAVKIIEDVSYAVRETQKIESCFATTGAYDLTDEQKLRLEEFKGKWVDQLKARLDREVVSHIATNHNKLAYIQDGSFHTRWN